MKKEQIYRLALAVYGIVMLWLLFGQRMGHLSFDGYAQQLRMNLNLRPFDTVRRYLWVLRNSTDPALIRTAVVNLGGNVLMFVPLGFLLPGVGPRLRRFGWLLLGAVLLIVSVELIQWLSLLGSCDVDDLILNLAGIGLGFALWKWIHRPRPDCHSERSGSSSPIN